MKDTWLKWVLAGLLSAIVGSYGWSTSATWRLEDKLERRLDRLESLIIEQFKSLKRSGE